jgi:3-hydroxyacyl-[acyl-carrier-protein] dehydratase
VNAIARGLPLPEKPIRLSIAEIAEIMPHQPPFLFLQDAELRSNESSGTYRISGQEPFLQGHFKDRPVFPASLQLEALGQLAVLFLLKGKHPEIAAGVDPTKIYFTAANGVRCSRICKPNDILSLIVRPKRVKHPLAIFEGCITVSGEKASFVEEVSLTFDYLPPPAVVVAAEETASAVVVTEAVGSAEPTATTQTTEAAAIK